MLCVVTECGYVGGELGWRCHKHSVSDVVELQLSSHQGFSCQDHHAITQEFSSQHQEQSVFRSDHQA